MARSTTFPAPPASRRAGAPLLALIAVLALMLIPGASAGSDTTGRSLPVAEGVHSSEPAAGRTVEARLSSVMQQRAGAPDRPFVPLATPPIAVTIAAVLLLAYTIAGLCRRFTRGRRGRPAGRAPPRLAVTH